MNQPLALDPEMIAKCFVSLRDLAAGGMTSGCERTNGFLPRDAADEVYIHGRKVALLSAAESEVFSHPKLRGQRSLIDPH